MTDSTEITSGQIQDQIQDVTDETVTDENSQLAQAATTGDTIRIESPGSGQTVTIAVDPGQIVIAIGLTSAQMQNAVTQDGGSLIVTWPDGGIVILEDYLVIASGDLPPQLTLADGTVISFDDLTASIEGFDPGAVAPAAGGGGDGNASFADFVAEDIGDGIDPTNLLDPTALNFGLLEPEQELGIVSEPEVPPVIETMIFDETRGDDDFPDRDDPNPNNLNTSPSDPDPATDDDNDAEGEGLLVAAGNNNPAWFAIRDGGVVSTSDILDSATKLFASGLTLDTTGITNGDSVFLNGGAQMTIHGDTVNVVYLVVDGVVYGVTDLFFDGEEFSYNEPVFAVVYDSATGLMSFVEFHQIDHPDDTDPDDSIFLDVALTGGGIITVDIQDDGPTLSEGSTTGMVDEADIGEVSQVFTMEFDSGVDGEEALPGHGGNDTWTEGGLVATGLWNEFGGHLHFADFGSDGSRDLTDHGQDTQRTEFTTVTPGGSFTPVSYEANRSGNIHWVSSTGAEWEFTQVEGETYFFPPEFAGSTSVLFHSHSGFSVGIENLSYTLVVSSTSGTIAVDYNKDGPGDVTVSTTVTATDPDDGDAAVELESGGKAVTWTEVSPGVLEATAEGSAEVLARLAVDTDGNWGYTQLGEFDHPDEGVVAEGESTGVNDQIELTFDVTFTDVDGDPVVEQITVFVKDDGPTADIGIEQVIEGEQFVDAMVVLDETKGGEGAFDDNVAGNPFDLAWGTPIGLVSGITLVNDGTTTDAGADGVKSIEYSLSLTNSTSGLKTTDGTVIELFEETDGTVTGRTGGVDGTVIFAISIDDDGDVTVAQYFSLQHNLNGLDDDDVVDLDGSTLHAVITVTDGDDDTATDSVVIGDLIKFEDDGPMINEGESTTSGMVEEADITKVGGDTVVIDFESLAHDGDFTFPDDPYIEDGFVLNNLSKVGEDFYVVGPESDPYFGSAAIGNNLPDGITELTKDGGGTFTLSSIDLAENGADTVSSVTFTGWLGGVIVATQTFELDGVNGSGETFAFDSSFEGVDAVTWPQINPFHIFDNIVVTPDVTVPDTTSGTIVIDYGADGAGLVAVSVSTTVAATDLDDGPNDPVTLESGGLAVTWTEVSDGVLEATDSGSSDVLARLTVNSDGSWDYEQFGEFDHPDAGADGVETGTADQIKLTFDITFTDGDNDPVDTKITVFVKDDGPTLDILTGATEVVESGSTINGTWETDPGADGATTVIDITGGSSGLALNTPIVLTAGTLQVNGDGTWTFDPTNDGTVEFTIVTTDGDGDTASDSHEITITDGAGPSAGNASLVHDESAGLQTSLTPDPNPLHDEDNDDDDIVAPGALVTAADAAAETATGDTYDLAAIGAVQATPTITAGSDAIASIVFSGIAEGDTVTGLLTSDGNSVVKYVVINANLILGVTDYVDVDEFGDVVFSLHLDGGTGEFTFIQYEAVEHTNLADDDEGLGTPLSIGYTVTDTDGTPDSGTFTVDIEDDGPVASSVDNLVLANFLNNSATLDLGFTVGADEPGTYKLTEALGEGGTNITLVEGDFVWGFIDDSTTATKMTSTTSQVTTDLVWHKVNDSTWQAVLEGDTDSVVFTVTVNSNGTYTIALDNPLVLDGGVEGFKLDLTGGVEPGNTNQIVVYDSVAPDDNTEGDPPDDGVPDGIPDGATIMALVLGFDGDGAAGDINSSTPGMGVDDNFVNWQNGNGPGTDASETLKMFFAVPQSLTTVTEGNITPKSIGFIKISLNHLTVGEGALVRVNANGTWVYLLVVGEGNAAGDTTFIITQGTEGTGSSSGDGLTAATAYVITMSSDGSGGITGTVEVNGTFNEIDFMAESQGDGYRLLTAEGQSSLETFDLDTSFTAQVTDADGDVAATEFDVEFSGGTTLTGTSGDDVLQGNGDDEIIMGLGGNDLLIGDGGVDTLIGGTGNDTLWGDDIGNATDTGADQFRFESVTDGNDTIMDYQLTDGDTINLDMLFDALGTGDAVARAGVVDLENETGDTVITVTGQAGFSITVDGVDLGDTDGGALSVAELAAKGIIVGDES